MKHKPIFAFDFSMNKPAMACLIENELSFYIWPLNIDKVAQEKLDSCDITLFEDVILENNLLFHKEIDDELLVKLNQDNCYYENYNKVVKYILLKMRSEKQIKEYMDKLSIKNLDQDKMLNKLKENNLINEEGDRLQTKNQKSDGKFHTK